MQIRMFAVLGFLVSILPCAARAEVWKWRDPTGRLVYSNVKETVPAQVAAEEVRGEIGFMGGGVEPPPASRAAEPREPAAPPADHADEPTQRHRIRNSRLGAIARYADVFPYWPIYLWQWQDYQSGDPIGTQLWLYDANSELQLRRWGLGS